MDKGKAGVSDCGPTEDSALVKHEESLGGDGTFTYEEIEHFVTVVKEGRNGEDEDTTVIVDLPSKAVFESLGPFPKEQIEEKLATAAFRSFAPGLPMIPPERFVEVLSSRRAERACKLYKIGPTDTWPRMKNALLAKRLEILSAYREVLIADMRTRLQSESMLKRKTGEDNCRDDKRQPVASAGSDALSAPVVHPGNTEWTRKPVFTKPEPRTPGLIPERLTRTYGIRNESLVPYGERQDATKSRDAEITRAQARYPTPPEDERRSSVSHVEPDGHLDAPFVTLRRKKAPREAESRLAQGRTYGQTTNPYIPDKPVFTRPSPAKAHSTDAGNDQSRPCGPSGSSPSRSSPVEERNDQSHSSMGRVSRLYGFRLRYCRSFEELDREATQGGPLSDALQYQTPQDHRPREGYSSSNGNNYTQLSPDYDFYSDNEVPYDYYESEEEEASEDGYSADLETLEDEDDMRWARPRSPETQTLITLRKLAKMRDDAIKRKAALALAKDEQRVQAQNPRHDLMTSPDSDYSLDYAMHRSPPGTRFFSTFTFRGYRFDLPVSGGHARRIREEQIRRGRPDYWTVREDPESPSPVRSPGPDPDHFLLDSESEGELLYPSDHTDDWDTDEAPLRSDIIVY